MTNFRFLPIVMAAIACISCEPAASETIASMPLEDPCAVTDGDTIRCGDERIRLLAIDAPEMPGHCAKGRKCVEGDPYEAKGSLQDALAGRLLSIRRMGQDRHGRTLAVIYADGQNTSCYQLAAGHAVYAERWDTNGIVARECPRWAR